MHTENARKRQQRDYRERDRERGQKFIEQHRAQKLFDFAAYIDRDTATTIDTDTDTDTVSDRHR